MSERRAGDWLKTYLKYSTGTEAPAKFHFWTAVSVLASALRRNVWLDFKRYKWYPNFYVVLVAKPGVVNKTTTFELGYRLLRSLDREDIYFGPESTNWQTLLQFMGKCTAYRSMPDGIELPTCAVSQVVGELGTFLTTQDGSMIDHLVSLWDTPDKTFEKATKTAGTDIITNPCLNIMGGTTPSWVSKNIPQYMIGGGFTSRTIFSYATEKSSVIAYPHLHFNANNFAALEDDLKHDLNLICDMYGEITMSKEALDFGIEWYEKFWSKSNSELREENVEGYRARKQVHMHKLAMIFMVAESDKMILEKHHLEKALKIMDSVEADFNQVFQSVGSTFDGDLAGRILSYVQANSRCSKTQIFANFLRQANLVQLENALKSLVMAKAVSGIDTGGSVLYVAENKAKVKDNVLKEGVV